MSDGNLTNSTGAVSPVPDASHLSKPEIPDAPPIDKSTWGDGPWSTEPDRLEWRHAGLPCLAVRHERYGHFCGYAAVPPGHPLHGQPDADVAVHDGVHYGVNYANRCAGAVCHVAQPGEPDDVWWLGFDCAHAGDFLPGMHARLRAFGDPFDQAPYDHAAAVAAHTVCVDVYRDLAYVQAEVNRLAEQLAAIV